MFLPYSTNLKRNDTKCKHTLLIENPIKKKILILKILRNVTQKKVLRNETERNKNCNKKYVYMVQYRAGEHERYKERVNVVNAAFVKELNNAVNEKVEEKLNDK